MLAHVIYWQLPQQLPVHVLLCMQVLLPPCETTSSELRPFANLWDHSGVHASEAYRCANLLAFAFLPIPAKVYADAALVRCSNTLTHSKLVSSEKAGDLVALPGLLRNKCNKLSCAGKH